VAELLCRPKQREITLAGTHSYAFRNRIKHCGQHRSAVPTKDGQINMYTATRKTAATVSAAVKEFLQENDAPLDSLSANLVQEKIFTDKKEYTVELYSKTRPAEGKPAPVSMDDIEHAKSVLEKMLSLMKFTDAAVEIKQEGNAYILKISAGVKDGLIIGKNGQNLLAIQYLMSIAMDKHFHRHLPVIIDVDSYREKRVAYLKNMVRTMVDRARDENNEVMTDLLPSYERKLIHEEVSADSGLKTFSIGRGSYKKVVITPLL
jgi:spoIIIJ-associated protein